MFIYFEGADHADGRGMSNVVAVDQIGSTQFSYHRLQRSQSDDTISSLPLQQEIKMYLPRFFPFDVFCCSLRNPQSSSLRWKRMSFSDTSIWIPVVDIWNLGSSCHSEKLSTGSLKAPTDIFLK